MQSSLHVRDSAAGLICIPGPVCPGHGDPQGTGGRHRLRAWRRIKSKWLFSLSRPGMIRVPAHACHGQQSHQPEPFPALAVRPGERHQTAARRHFPDEPGRHGRDLKINSEISNLPNKAKLRFPMSFIFRFKIFMISVIFGAVKSHVGIICNSWDQYRTE